MGLDQRSLDRLNFIWGGTNVVLSVIGIYFVYRFAVTVLVLEPENREILLGPLLAQWLPVDDTFITVLASLYIAFKTVTILIAASRWEMNLNTRDKRAKSKNRTKMLYQEQRETDPSEMKLRDFTG